MKTSLFSRNFALLSSIAGLLGGASAFADYPHLDGDWNVVISPRVGIALSHGGQNIATAEIPLSELPDTLFDHENVQVVLGTFDRVWADRPGGI